MLTLSFLQWVELEKKMIASPGLVEGSGAGWDVPFTKYSPSWNVSFLFSQVPRGNLAYFHTKFIDHIELIYLGSIWSFN